MTAASEPRARAVPWTAGSWIVSGLAICVAAFVVFAPLRDVVGWTAIILATATAGTLAWRNPALRAPLLCGLALRVTATLMQFYVVPLPGTGMDTITFERLGWAWSQDGWDGLVRSFTLGAWLYSWIIAVLYWIGTRSELLVQSVNVLVGTLVVFNVFQIARLLWGDKGAERAAWWAALFPTLVLNSAIILREVFVVYPLTLGIVCFVRWRLSGRMIWLPAAVGCMSIAVIFHSGVVGALAVVGATVVFEVLRSLNRARGRARFALLLGSAAAVVMLLAVAGFVASRVNLFVLASVIDFMAGHQAGTYAADRTDYLPNMVVSTPVDILWQAPIRFLFFQFMPFPWLIRTPADIFGLLDSGLYALLVFQAFRARAAIRMNPAARSVVWAWVGCVLVYGLLISNYGTAIRHRAKMAPLLIAVAAAGMPRGVRASEEQGPCTR